MVRVYILYGGLFSADGLVTSAGMGQLAGRLREFCEVTTYLWGNYELCVRDIGYDGGRTVIIGYSGGGWRACTVANLVRPMPVHLLVAYDPSPSWNMGLKENILHDNVKKAVCYYNRQKMFIPFVGWIGGGMVESEGPSVETVKINQNHLAVQFSDSLHERTIALVKDV